EGGRQDEYGQGAGWILDGEVAVRDLAAKGRVPVALVDRRVEQQPVRVEAVVERPPGRQERRDAERDGERGPATQVIERSPRPDRQGERYVPRVLDRSLSACRRRHRGRCRRRCRALPRCRGCRCCRERSRCSGRWCRWWCRRWSSSRAWRLLCRA